jgi:carboxylate-amine ligase
MRKIGVEEELLLVDPETGRVTAVAQQAVRAEPEVEAELYLQQMESQTPPVATLSEMAGELRRERQGLVDAAEAAGAAAVAGGTPELAMEAVAFTPTDRYRRIADEYGELAGSALACATHVHVDVTPDEAVRVVDGIAPWLPALLALSANSPYWQGRDTGHASWRSQLWSRWPSYGTGQAFGDRATYDEVAARLVDWGAGLDPGMVYLPARLSPKYPTVEVRVADVCTELGDTLLVAALARGLVATAAATEPSPPWRSELVRASTWRAARCGIADRLVHPATLDLAKADDVVDALVTHVTPALEEHGDVNTVRDLLAALRARGTGATAQRRTFEKHGDLAEVVHDLRRRTAEAAVG